MTVRPVPGLPSTTSNRFTSSLPKIIYSCHCHILPKNISPLPKIICLCHCHILPKIFPSCQKSSVHAIAISCQNIFPPCQNHLSMPLPHLANLHSLIAKIIPLPSLLYQFLLPYLDNMPESIFCLDCHLAITSYLVICYPMCHILLMIRFQP